jgi:hypothetical protein
VVADLDGDGSLDVLQASDDRTLHALSLSGGEVPGWPRTFHEAISSTPFVADLDGDGDLDVAVGDDLFVRVLDVTGPATPGAAPWPGYHGGELLQGVYSPPPLVPTDLAGPAAGSSTALQLRPAAPNPFRAGTELRFATPTAGPVTLEIFDVHGRRVAVPLAGEPLDAGAHAVRWDGRNRSGRAVAAGVYFLRLQAGSEARSGKILRLR